VSCPRRVKCVEQRRPGPRRIVAAGFGLFLVWLVAATVGVRIGVGAQPIDPKPGAIAPSFVADDWLTNVSVLSIPGLDVPVAIDPVLFAGLRAEALGGRLRISWQAESLGLSMGCRQLTVQASAAEPGQWPVRDWRSYSMKTSGNLQQADIPTEDLDVPIVYYARGTTAQGDRISPLRVVHPRQLGLEEPTQLFWPFVEGFEDGYHGWWILSGIGRTNAGSLRISSEGKNGRAALQISLPEGGSTIQLATTRVRGWQLLQEGATGLRFWVRTRSGTGSVRCSLQARSSTTNQVIGAWPRAAAAGDHWQKIDLTLAQLPILPWRSVDLLVMEFRAPSATEFLLDDVQLLGPWKLHPE